MWSARDKDGLLYLFFDEKPIKGIHTWYNKTAGCREIRTSLFPEVQWSDKELTKTKLIIDGNIRTN